MNEEKSVMNSEKPRKKKHSLWWIWFLLILAAFAGGAVCGLKINTLPLPTEVKDRLYPVLESYIPGSTTPRTPDTAVTVPAATLAPTPEPTSAPELTPAPEEEPVMQPETTPAPEATEPAAFALSENAAFRSSAEGEKKYIGVSAALDAALDHAKIAAEDAEISGVFRTKDADEKTVYEVSFMSGEYTYDYVIDAYTGEVDGWKISGFSLSDNATFAASFDGDAVTETEAVTAALTLIGEEKAKEIAFEHAAVKETQVQSVTVDLQGETDAETYKVAFKTATRSLEYEIDAYTGEILGYELVK